MDLDSYAHRLLHQSVPEGQPQFHPPRDTGAGAPGRRGTTHCSAGVGRRVAGRRRHGRTGQDPLCVARRRQGVADANVAGAACATAAFFPGLAGGHAPWPARRPRVALPPGVPGRGLPGVAMAAGRGGQTRACPFWHQLYRGSDAGQLAGRSGLQLYRAWAGRIRQTTVPAHGREGAACRLCCRGKFLRAQPAVSLGGARALGQGESGALRPGARVS
ncbi:hypothetical protein D3C80_1226280 [compost metagenome]